MNERWNISYVCVYVNVAVNSGMLELYLLHDSYNIIFEIIYKLYVASLSAPPPSEKF